MDKKVKEIIDELRVTILDNSNLDKPGHYISALNIIVLNSSLNDFEMTKVLLHELGHAALHQDNCKLYNVTFALHSKMENEAETFMSHQLVRQYMEIHNADPASINYMDFITDNELSLDLAPKVREWFLEYR